MHMGTKLFPDLDSLSRAAMHETMAILRDAVAQRGRFCMALSGGHTPTGMYRLWADASYRDQTPWKQVHLLWGDERYVPHDDPLSNSPALEEKQRWVLPAKVPATLPVRITLTPVVLNCGHNTVFLVSGNSKRQIIAALRNEPDPKTSQYPAARIQPVGRLLWLLDQAAAG